MIYLSPKDLPSDLWKDSALQLPAILHKPYWQLVQKYGLTQDALSTENQGTVIDDPGIIEQIAEHKYQQTLKMAIDEMILDDPGIIEQICQQTLDKPVSLKRARIQKDAYKNCTVIAVCNKKWHGMGRKPWMCIENMQLAATADGLGIVTSIFREEHKVAVEKLLALISLREPVCLKARLIFGKPALGW